VLCFAVVGELVEAAALPCPIRRLKGFVDFAGSGVKALGAIGAADGGLGAFAGGGAAGTAAGGSAGSAGGGTVFAFSAFKRS
jgi:hypothetical protein